MIDVGIGQEMDLDISEEKTAEMVYLLLKNRQGTVTDTRNVPLSARYLVLHGESYVRDDGSPGTLFPGKEVTLPQEVASRFLASGHVRPVDPTQWIPLDLIHPRTGGGEVKKMYDKIPEKSTNWASDGLRRKG
jgi:hypothetical protein